MRCLWAAPSPHGEAVNDHGTTSSNPTIATEARLPQFVGMDVKPSLAQNSKSDLLFRDEELYRRKFRDTQRLPTGRTWCLTIAGCPIR